MCGINHKSYRRAAADPGQSKTLPEPVPLNRFWQKQQKYGYGRLRLDLDPHGSGTFAWIRIRNSENSKLDPDPE